jgi:tRNA(Arg) A34 adenosine deaminase TadA
VIGDLDITAHAEITVIREACRTLRSLQLQDCVLYVTVQPCPMCLTACYYAGIREVVYGASIDALNEITGNELCAAPAELFAGRPEQPLLTAGVLADDCRALLSAWGDSR